MIYFSRISFTVFLLLWVSVLFAQEIVLKQTNDSGIYSKGERIEVVASLNDIEADSLTVKIRKNYNVDVDESKIPYRGGEFTVFSEVYNEPSAVIVEVYSGEKFASTGAIVEPGAFYPGSIRPKDFDKFWKNEKKALRSLPLEVKREEVDNTEKGYRCWDMEINCTGPKPARGYFAKPEAAEPKSLPIVLYLHAAGVKGSWCLSRPEEALKYAKMGKGALAFDLNAHGMLNGQSQEYYDKLEEGELNHYWEQGVESRDTYYFKGMYLRLMRTLDFLTSQPEWDGKRILVLGESQGGGQSLAAAGLDHRVSAVVATVPAMSNFISYFKNAIAGWPNPTSFDADKNEILKTVPYFDTAHLLKGCKATLITEIGLIDVTCPSYAVYAAINQSKGEKITFAVPYRGHHLNQSSFQKKWEETVYAPKMKFIEDYLK